MKTILPTSLIIGFLTVAVSFGSAQTEAQDTIKGYVVDIETNEPLPGVSVAVKGTTAGTVSDVDGKFSLVAKSFPVTLVFSATGFRSQEVEVVDTSEELPIQ